MGKIEEQLLADFKKANKTRKESLAKKYGFDNAEQYLNYLENITYPNRKKETIETVKKVVKGKKAKVKPTIHIVNLLDNSGSMSGKKFDNAYLGIKEEVKLLQVDTTANYTYTLFHFTDIPPYTGKATIDNVSIANVVLPKLNADTGTPLYDTIIEIRDLLIGKQYPVDTKVLVKIFTDGRDEHSKSYVKAAATAINEMKVNGITVTFVGTEEDVKFIIDKLNIDKSNTLVHDNTGEGVKAAFAVSNNATLNYTKNVVAGNDVSKGFYKNIK